MILFGQYEVGKCPVGYDQEVFWSSDELSRTGDP